MGNRLSEAQAYQTPHRPGNFWRHIRPLAPPAPPAENGPMDHNDFKIGETFWMSGAQWRCTDVGTRTVCAIKLDDRDPSWFTGPPYPVAEHCLDEDDIETCSIEPDG